MTCDKCGQVEPIEEKLGHGIFRYFCPICNYMIAAVFCPYSTFKFIKIKVEE